jgi:hypothetical protein
MKDRTYIYVGEHKDGTYNFDKQTSWKIAIWLVGWLVGWLFNDAFRIEIT